MVVLASPLILELILGSVLAVHFLRGGISSVLALLAYIANTRANTPTSVSLGLSDRGIYSHLHSSPCKTLDDSTRVSRP